MLHIKCDLPRNFRKLKFIILFLIINLFVIINIFFAEKEYVDSDSVSCVVEQRTKPSEVRIISQPLYFITTRDVQYLIIVKSVLSEYEERNVIRNSWIREAVDLGIICIFTIGYSENSTLNSAVEIETSQYNDILQSNVPEQYNNLALKMYVTMKWLSTQNIKVIFFTDTDILVFPVALKQIMENYAKKENVVTGYCHLDGPTVNRDPSSKWCISMSVYDKPNYPQYCGGGGYFMTSDVPQKLLEVIPGGRDNWQWAYNIYQMDDVTFTGILREAANVSIESASGLIRLTSSHYADPCRSVLRFFGSIAACYHKPAVIVNSVSKTAYIKCWNEYSYIAKKCKLR